MRKKPTSIPVNITTDDFGTGIAVDRFDLRKLDRATAADLETAKRAHREDRHSFFLLETGSIRIEIDFETHVINSPSITYMHPDQVHRMLEYNNVVVSSLAICNENLNPEYREFLESIRPVKPAPLTDETYPMIAEAMARCIKLAQGSTGKLHHRLLSDSCNMVVGLVITQFMEQAPPTDGLSRFAAITKAFRDLLEVSYHLLRRPAEYAQRLNISTPYLNECVKNTTGHPVSYHIRQRIILEAKRLLHHSDTSVKEIAAELGYDDYPYFSRLFTKTVGMAALAFRAKNFD